MNNTILSILKNSRNAKGLTQSEAAVALKVKGNTVGNYENGKTQVMSIAEYILHYMIRY